MDILLTFQFSKKKKKIVTIYENTTKNQCDIMKKNIFKNKH